MELSTIEMKPEDAKAAFDEYREAVISGPRDKFADAKAEYEEMDQAIMRGYKALAKGQSLLRLSESMALGGTEHFTVERWNWRRDIQETVTVVLPRLAISRADAFQVWANGIREEGGMIFRADDQSSERKADKVVIPDGTFADAPESRPWGVWHRAIVPTIPPPFRPPHKLSGYHVLWEADWEFRAPVDPALLKHLGGDLYAVLAVWDLTDLEQAVLAGRAAA